jgi:predicted RNA methylase
MNAPRHEISEDVLGVVLRCKAEGDKLFLPDEQLDRDLYLRVNKVLSAEGGKWNRRAKAHVFPRPAEDILARLRAGAYEDPKKDLGFYETPPGLASRIVTLAGIEPGMQVLEPSAGRGALVRPMIEAGGTVTAVEISEDLVAELAALRPRPGSVIHADFLAYDFGIFAFDRVVMNPPFAHSADVEHVTKAFALLRPGGRLVSIMSAAVEFREDKVHKLFRKLLGETGSIVARLPSGTFKESGTDVSTVIVVLERGR